MRILCLLRQYNIINKARKGQLLEFHVISFSRLAGFLADDIALMQSSQHCHVNMDHTNLGSVTMSSSAYEKTSAPCGVMVPSLTANGYFFPVASKCLTAAPFPPLPSQFYDKMH